MDTPDAMNSAPTLPADNGFCPDCRGGEHHPQHDVSYMNLDSLLTAYCECPCAKIMATPDPLIPRGTPVQITAGKMVDKLGTVVESLPDRAMYIIYITALNRQHYVPNEWVKTIE